MFTDCVGKVFRTLPSFKGKHLIGRRLMSPLLRGHGHKCLVEMSSYGGGLLLCHLDDWIPWNVFLYGNYHVEALYEQVMLSFAERADVVVDVGANIGYYSVQFGRITRGSVYSFEPMSHQYRILQQNIAINRLHNVQQVQKIVSDSEGVARIYFAGTDNSGMSSLERRTNEFQDVVTTTLDMFAREKGLDGIDLLKIDVEGHELKVLQGANGLLAQGKIKYLFVEINYTTLRAGNTSPNAVCSYLGQFGYEPVSIKTGRLEAYIPGTSESLVLFRRAMSLLLK